MSVELNPNNEINNLSSEDNKVGVVPPTNATKSTKRATLSNEEKLALMKKFMHETGETIKTDTYFEGYDLGSMRNNLRVAYHNGTLKMDEALLKEFIDSGIIVEEKERIRTTDQEKYDFLMSTIGLDKKTLSGFKMSNGMKYVDVKHFIQVKYNKRELGLENEQIENLKNNGILDYTPEEKAQILNQYNLPAKYALDIEKKYGSYENFIEKFKNCEIDYDFGKDVFVGYRGIIISEKELTEAQKLGYSKLVKEMYGEDKSYIDADKIQQAIENNSKQKEALVLKLKYGLTDGKEHTISELAKEYAVSNSIIGNIANHAVENLKVLLSKGNAIQDIENLKATETELKKQITSIKAIKEYITNADGSPKTREEIKNIELAELNIENSLEFTKGENAPITIYDLIYDERIDVDKLLIQDLNLSSRSYNGLKRAGIKTVGELLELEDNNKLENIRNLGSKSSDEIKEKIKKFREIAENGGYSADLTFEDKAENKGIEDKIKSLLEYCDELLKNKLPKLEETTEYINRYEEAKKNYLEIEDIFNPEGIVPAVHKTKEIEVKEEVENVQEIESDDIKSLNLSVGIYNCLKRAGIDNVGKLLELDDEKIKRIRNLGPKKYEELKAKIEEIKSKQNKDIQEKQETKDEKEVNGNVQEVSNSKEEHEEIKSLSTEEIEQKTEEEQRKEELIESIKNHQQELEELKEKFKEIENSKNTQDLR